MNSTRLVFSTALAVAISLFYSVTNAGERFITVASTTSTRNSGLYDYLLPKFTKKTGIKVRVVAVGTGQAIRLARGGDADVLLVHHRQGEEKFVADGFGIKRYDLMYNDFVLVGPSEDPSNIDRVKDISTALAKIAHTRSTFVSRGDDSGTHRKELSLWLAAGFKPSDDSGKWYREAGAGMGATLNTASGMNAHTLTDRGTWLKFANKGGLKILVEGDKRLVNPYGVIVVNPAKHPHIKEADAKIFVKWLVSLQGQSAISAYRLKGHQAFFGNAKNLLN